MSILVCDIDGVLNEFSNSDFQHYHKKDWPKLDFSLSCKKPNKGGVNLVKKLAPNFNEIVFLTGRLADKRKETESFLLKALGVQFYSYNSKLVMKPDQSFNSVEFKKNWILMTGCKEQIGLAIDDRRDIIEMYQSLNIPAILVGRNFPLTIGELR